MPNSAPSTSAASTSRPPRSTGTCRPTLGRDRDRRPGVRQPRGAQDAGDPRPGRGGADRRRCLRGRASAMRSSAFTTRQDQQLRHRLAGARQSGRIALSAAGRHSGAVAGQRPAAAAVQDLQPLGARVIATYRSLVPCRSGSDSARIAAGSSSITTSNSRPFAWPGGQHRQPLIRRAGRSAGQCGGADHGQPTARRREPASSAATADASGIASAPAPDATVGARPGRAEVSVGGEDRRRGQQRRSRPA